MVIRLRCFAFACKVLMGGISCPDIPVAAVVCQQVAYRPQLTHAHAVPTEPSAADICKPPPQVPFPYIPRLYERLQVGTKRSCRNKNELAKQCVLTEISNK